MINLGKEYYEIAITAMIEEDVIHSKANEFLSKFINKAMLSSELLSKVHLAKGYKLYSYSSFYPTEADKVYKKGKIYLFRLRGVEKNFIIEMKRALKQLKGDTICVLSIELIVKRLSFINTLITITPVIVTCNDDKHWQHGQDIELLKKRLHNNLKNKYKVAYGECIQDKEFFMSGFEILNEKTICISYKGGYLLGNKFKFTVREDYTSQLIAAMSLSCGMGEKTSIGMGFCYAN